MTTVDVFVRKVKAMMVCKRKREFVDAAQTGGEICCFWRTEKCSGSSSLNYGQLLSPVATSDSTYYGGVSLFWQFLEGAGNYYRHQKDHSNQKTFLSTYM